MDPMQQVPQPQSIPTPMPVQPIAQSPYMPTPDHAPRRGRFFVIGILILVIASGAYAAGAWYMKWWPFAGAPRSVGNKQQAFDRMVGVLKDLKTASYQGSVSMEIQPRDAGAEPISLDFPEFKAEEELYTRDQDKIGYVSSLLYSLDNYYYDYAKKYPATLDEVKTTYYGDYQQVDKKSIEYAPNADMTDYTLSVTLETDAAVESMKKQALKSKDTKAPIITVSGKKVTLTKESGISFYFYSRAQMPSLASRISDLNEGFSYLSSDFSFEIHGGGTMDRNDVKSPDSKFQVGGTFSSGDFNVAADVEVVKKSDMYFARVNKMPSLFIDLSAVKEKWIKITPDDFMGTFGDISYVQEFTNESKEKSDKYLAQLRSLVAALWEKKVIVIDYSLPDQVQNEKKYYVYGISFDGTKMPEWYEATAKKLQDEYKEDALMKLDSSTLKVLQSQSFQKYIASLNTNLTTRLFIDTTTGYPSHFETSLRVVPNATAIKLKDKQLRISTKFDLADVNKPIDIQAPTGAMTFDEAQQAVTGQSLADIQFSKQVAHIETIRLALKSYFAYTGSYPATLDDLKKTRNEVQKKVSWFGNLLEALRKQFIAKAQVSIDFPENFAGFSDDSDSYMVEYANKQLDKPFLKTIPLDVYTKTPYEYHSTQSGYTLIYSMTLPKIQKEKTTSSSSGLLGLFYGGSMYINEILNYADGKNTATQDDISAEAKEALKKDSDGDKLPDVVENYYGSSNSNKDSDGDSYNDYDEVTKGYDPMGKGKLNYYDKWHDPQASKSFGLSQPKSLPSAPACIRENQKVSADQKCCYGFEASGGVCVKGKPDLTVKSITAAHSGVMVKICNDGTAESPQFDATVTSGSRPQWNTVNSPLAAGTCNENVIMGYVGLELSAGNRWKDSFSIELDPKNTVTEKNEKNNSLTKNIDVQVKFGCVKGDEGYGIDQFNYGSIYNENLKITEPKKGDVVPLNKQYVITWSSKDINNALISIYVNDECGMQALIAKDIKNEGNFTWDVKNVKFGLTSLPITPSGKYSLYMSAFASDASRKFLGYTGTDYFTIK